MIFCAKVYYINIDEKLNRIIYTLELEKLSFR